MEANNVKAMREALEELVANIEMRSSTFGLNVMVDTKVFLDAKAALAAPPRNCDKFADAETASRAWLDDAKNWDEFGSPELELHEWLFAMAAERKGENHGSK